MSMTKAEATQQVTTLAKLFGGQVNQTQAAELVTHFMAMSVDAVAKGISEHRHSPDLVNGFWHMGKLLQSCRAAARNNETASRSTSANELTFAETMRRQNPALAKLTDYQTILVVYRDLWFRSSRAEKSAEGIPWKPEECVTVQGRIGPIGSERKYRTLCQNALAMAGMLRSKETYPEDWKIVETWADLIFADPAWFRRGLEDVKGAPSVREQGTVPEGMYAA